MFFFERVLSKVASDTSSYEEVLIKAINYINNNQSSCRLWFLTNKPTMSGTALDKRRLSPYLWFCFL